MIDPVAFSFFGFDIHWYGIYYAIGFLLSYFFVMHFAKDFGVEKHKVEDAFFYFMIFSVLGGRILYGVFYNFEFFLNNPIEIFKVWNGGMSIHGAFLVGILALAVYARGNNIEFLRLLDLFAVPTAIGLAFGRFANFINQELVGKVTSSSFGIVFPLYDDQIRWPTTLFESAKNIFVFQFLLYLQFFKNLKPGIISAWFLILYNLGRFVVDFLRVPTVDLGIISMGQLLCLIYMFAGVLLLIYVKCEKN